MARAPFLFQKTLEDIRKGTLIPSPESIPKQGLEVARDGTMENGAGDEQQKPESDNGVGVMVKGRIGSPGVDDFIVPPWQDSTCKRAHPKRMMEAVATWFGDTVVTQMQLRSCTKGFHCLRTRCLAVFVIMARTKSTGWPGVVQEVNPSTDPLFPGFSDILHPDFSLPGLLYLR